MIAKTNDIEKIWQKGFNSGILVAINEIRDKCQGNGLFQNHIAWIKFNEQLELIRKKQTDKTTQKVN